MSSNVSMNPGIDRRAFVRTSWYAALVLTLAILIASLPGYALHVSRIPTAPAVAAPPAFVTAMSVADSLVSIGVALLSIALAVALFRRRQDDGMAVFVSFFLMGYGVLMGGPLEALDALLPGMYELALTLQSVFFAFPTLLFLLLFPNGRFVPRWTRWLVPLSVAFLPLPLLSSTTAWFAFASAEPVIVAVALGAMLLIGIGAQVHRYRRVSTTSERQQTKWVVFGILLWLLAMAILTIPFVALLNIPAGEVHPWWAPLSKVAWWLSLMILPLSLAIAMMRFRLWDIDIIVNRTLVYGALTACVVGLYVLIVGAFGALIQSSGSLLLSLIATGLIALLFQPLRDRLQRAVNRRMYGQRDDPYAVLSQLGRQLHTTLAPQAVLPSIVETVARALKLPYAAIALSRGEPLEVEAAYGLPGEDATYLPLVYQGEMVGQLIVAQRAPGETFTPTEQRLLEDIARQAGVAVHAVQLTSDLQRSRERLVLAREEERRRLRRDLHDGLGATLAAVNLQLAGLRNSIERDPASAHDLVDEVRSDIHTAIADIRRLVYDLRPPALDELGLVPSLRAQASRYNANGLRVSVDAPEHMPPLAAAVEAAVYRITQEALTNVARHAQARNCVVRLRVNGGLQLEIVDDGAGFPPDRAPGVGLLSMRERAAELGGTCNVESSSGGGTRVSVWLPVGDR